MINVVGQLSLRGHWLQNNLNKPNFSKPSTNDKLHSQLSAFKKVCRKLLRKGFLFCKFSVIPAEGSLSSRKLGVLKARSGKVI